MNLDVFGLVTTTGFFFYNVANEVEVDHLGGRVVLDDTAENLLANPELRKSYLGEATAN